MNDTAAAVTDVHLLGACCFGRACSMTKAEGCAGIFLGVGSRCVVAFCEQRQLSDAVQPPPPAPARGPGTELKKLLAVVGITATPDCSCNARAAEMDRQGCDWCEQNIDTIVGWLREQAEARGLPFLDVAGRMLVRRAIRNARRAAETAIPPELTGGADSQQS